MKINTEQIEPLKKKTSVLCLFCYEGSSHPFGIGKTNTKLDYAIEQTIKETKAKEKTLEFIHTHDLIPAQKILIVGLGKKNKITAEILRNTSGLITKKIRGLGIIDFSLVITKDLPVDIKSTVSAIVEGANLSMYSFEQFKKEKTKNPEPNMTIISIDDVSKIISKALIISNAVKFTRSIANLPPNDCNPAKLADISKKLVSQNNLKCIIYSKNELKTKKFGGITAVGQGSKNESKLIILEYKNGQKQNKPILLVGKAVTFDTGGISLKPSEKMDEMKFDKCGGCTVLGIIKAITELKIPINVIGIIPCVENMADGEAYRPGDIIRLFNGKTAEILNTDAEGRLILADGLAFGIKQYQPSSVIDFATLTGACIVALGTNIAGLISNNKKMITKLNISSKKTSEEIWQLPINDDYMDMVKSDVADIKNVGVGRAAGTITAAAFLANAVGNTPWVHLDIAGTAWVQPGARNKSYNSKGATGFGVRLVIDYLTKNSSQNF
jgi:leucyl aminopeptidase